MCGTEIPVAPCALGIALASPKGLRKAKFRSLRLASKNESWEGRVGKIRSDRKPNNTIIRTSVQTSEICNGKLRRGMLAARHSGMIHKRHKSRGGGVTKSWIGKCLYTLESRGRRCRTQIADVNLDGAEGDGLAPNAGCLSRNKRWQTWKREKNE